MKQRKKKCARPSCRVHFVPGRVDQRYHDDACRNAHWREMHPRVQIHATPAGPGLSLHEVFKKRR